MCEAGSKRERNLILLSTPCLKVGVTMVPSPFVAHWDRYSS